MIEWEISLLRGMLGYICHRRKGFLWQIKFDFPSVDEYIYTGPLDSLSVLCLFEQCCDMMPFDLMFIFMLVSHCWSDYQ